MYRLIIILCLLISFSSCKSSKRKRYKKTYRTTVVSKKPKKKVVKKTPTRKKTKQEKIVDYAMKFRGTRYKFGGTSKSGMDCSGLVFESYRAYGTLLPRVSRDMAKKGKKISTRQVEQGDLLFFKTGNRRNSINHVGLVIENNNNSIKFIHSTTSKGVIVSRLSESYWNKAFYEARRIL